MPLIVRRENRHTFRSRGSDLLRNSFTTSSGYPCAFVYALQAVALLLHRLLPRLGLLFPASVPLLRPFRGLRLRKKQPSVVTVLYRVLVVLKLQLIKVRLGAGKR